MATIWIIDDEPLVARTLVRKLTRRSKHTTVFFDPREEDVDALLQQTAESSDGSGSPDVIVMDWNGHPVYRWMELAGDTPVIIWTGAEGVTTKDIPGATRVRCGKHIRVVLDIEEALEERSNTRSLPRHPTSFPVTES